MTPHRSGLHHYYKRKRAIKKANGHMVHIFDDFMYVIAIVMPLTTIPQIIEIWINKSAQSVSIVTWSAYVVSALFWLAYSIIHKETVLIINSVLWVLLELMVVVGVVIYG